MDIAPIIPPATRSLGATTPIAPTQAVAIEQAQSLSFLPVAPSTVDLSTQGRFLSLAALFQKKTLELQASVDAHTDTPQSLADVNTLAQALANAFNTLQTAPVDNAGLPAGTLGQPSLASQFLQQFGDPADEIQTNLAGIGVKLDTSPLGTSALSIDQAALNDAFARDPAATSNLLVRTGNAFFGVVTAQILQNTGNINLFADDEVSTTDSLGLPDLAATPATQVETNAPNLQAQRLVADDVRDGNELPDDRADGITLPGDVAATATAPETPAAPTAAQLANATVDAQAALAQSASQNFPTQNAAVRSVANPAAAQVAGPASAVQTVAAQGAAQAPVPPAPTQAATSANLPASEAQAQDQITTASPPNSASNAATVAQEARDLAQQLQAERTAARELDERIANASDEVRAALAREIDEQDARRVETLRQDRLRVQQQAAREDQERADALGRDSLARANINPVNVLAASPAIVSAETTPPLQVTPPPAVTPNQAELLARDPSTAAAIAAYNLNTGPFAAQQVRADVLAPKVRLVPPVASVAKVEPVAALDPSKGGQQAPLG